MLGAQRVPRVETTAPLANSSIHDRLLKACPLVDQTCFKFVDAIAILNQLTFLCSTL